MAKWALIHAGKGANDEHAAARTRFPVRGSPTLQASVHGMRETLSKLIGVFVTLMPEHDEDEVMAVLANCIVDDFASSRTAAASLPSPPPSPPPPAPAASFAATALKFCATALFNLSLALAVLHYAPALTRPSPLTRGPRLAHAKSGRGATARRAACVIISMPPAAPTETCCG